MFLNNVTFTFILDSKYNITYHVGKYFLGKYTICITMNEIAISNNKQDGRTALFSARNAAVQT